MLPNPARERAVRFTACGSSRVDHIQVSEFISHAVAPSGYFWAGVDLHERGKAIRGHVVCEWRPIDRLVGLYHLGVALRDRVAAIVHRRENFGPAGNKTGGREFTAWRERIARDMRSLIHQDQIAEKLEIARTIGVLTDYFVGPGLQAHRPGASIHVSRSPHVSDEAVKDYLIRLLHGFVSDHQIVVSAPDGSTETAREPVAAAA